MLLNNNHINTKLSRIYRKPNASQNSFKLLFLNNIATGELYNEGFRGAASPPGVFSIWKNPYLQHILLFSERKHSFSG